MTTHKLPVRNMTYTLQRSRKQNGTCNIIVTYHCESPTGGNCTVSHWIFPELRGRPWDISKEWCAARGVMMTPNASTTKRQLERAELPRAITVRQETNGLKLTKEHF